MTQLLDLISKVLAADRHALPGIQDVSVNEFGVYRTVEEVSSADFSPGDFERLVIGAVVQGCTQRKWEIGIVGWKDSLEILGREMPLIRILNERHDADAWCSGTDAAAFLTAYLQALEQTR